MLTLHYKHLESLHFSKVALLEFTNCSIFQLVINKGLVVVLDLHSDLLASSSVDVDNQGFIGTVTSSASFPLTDVDGFQIKPGHYNLVTANKISSLRLLYKYTI